MSLRFAGCSPCARLLVAMAVFLPCGCAVGQGGHRASAGTPTADSRPLFNGHDLDGWSVTRFGGQGDVEVREGQIQMGFGYPLTGITYLGEIPYDDYTVELSARRIAGNDFFAAVTFPVRESFCTFVAGGWGGTVVGISSIDGRDASENETTSYHKFENGQWYLLRIELRWPLLRCWIDDSQVVDLNLEGKELWVRPEVELSKPFGVCAYQSSAAIRYIRLGLPAAPQPAGRSIAPHGQSLQECEKTPSRACNPTDTICSWRCNRRMPLRRATRCPLAQ